MASRIITKKGSGAPLASDLVHGELAVDTVNKRLYTENAGGTIIELGTAPSTIDINAGTIDGTVIGGSSAAAGSFTTISASGEIAANGGVAFGDNDKATFGASDDLQIYHDGTNSYINNTGAGSLIIQDTDGTGDIFIRPKSGQTAIAAYNDNTVQLAHSGNVKLSTTATGIDVTGTVTADGLTVDGSVTLNQGSGDALNIFRSTDYATLKIGANSTDHWYLQEVGSNDLYLARVNSSVVDYSAKFSANGDISFYEDTGTTAKFFWDASAESLGIGTTSPAARLHVDANTAALMAKFTTYDANGGYIFWDFPTGGGGGYIGDSYHLITGTPTDNYFTVRGETGIDFSIAAIRAMRIDSSGNVGIGTTSPAAKLHLNSASTTAIVFDSDTSTQQYELGIGYGGVGTSSFYLYDNTASATRLVINSAGNVGINTTSPTGNLVVANAGGGGLNIGYNGTSVNYYDANEQIFRSGSFAERMRIDSAGNVGIGTSSPSAKLHLYKTGTSDVSVRIQNGQDAYASTLDLVANNDGGAIYNALTSSANSGTQHWKIWGGAALNTMAFSTAGTERMRIDSSGNLLIGTSTAGASKLVVNDDSIQVNTAKTPASASDTGTTGEIAWDANYVYVCVATNTWKRSALSTW